jgi:hypothetical protein
MANGREQHGGLDPESARRHIRELAGERFW